MVRHVQDDGRQRSLSRAAIVTAGLLAALAGVDRAQAAVITKTVLASAGPITFGDVGVDAFVAPFDSALGTLTSVGLRLTGTLTPGLEAFDVLSPLPAVFTLPVTLSPEVSIRVPGGVTQPLSAETVSFAQDGAPIRQRAVGTPETVDLSETIAPGALEVLPGRGVDVYITGHTFPTFGVTSPGFFGIYEGEDLVALSGQLEVTYIYTPSGGVPLPEPTSLGLVSAGLVGLGLAQRRRRPFALNRPGFPGGCSGRCFPVWLRQKRGLLLANDRLV